MNTIYYKEFINLISHEVKGPIAISLFQGESVLYDIEKGNYDKDYLVKEIGILNRELLKVGDLANKLFSIGKYEMEKMELCKENVDLVDLIKKEVVIFSKVNKNIKFNLNIGKNVGIVSLDKVLFIQVIDNLLANACKFSKKNVGIINVNCYKKGKIFFIEIEDNGVGLDNVDIKKIFDKYFIGNIYGVGLGVGLFLCEKIVKLHCGSIKALGSGDLGGAKFVIRM